jgi:putative transposase
VGQHRSTQRREQCLAADEGALRARLRRFSKDRPRWGYRRAHQQLLEEGWSVNRKRVQRLWREEGLRVPRRRRKRQRLGDSTVPADRLRAERPDHVWALDFQFDQTADGRVLKLLHIVDEFTREAMEVRCERRIDADHTVARLERILAQTGRVPQFIRCDNGPELTANAIRDWCRFSGAGSVFIEPGAPWQNPYVESFGSRIRDELLGVEQFSCLAEAKVMIDDWRRDYNERRPHSALGMMAPAKFARAWREAAENGKVITLAALAETRRTPQDAPVPVADSTNERNRDPGTTEAAPAGLLRSPLRGFAPQASGTTVQPDTNQPLSQQVDR